MLRPSSKISAVPRQITGTRQFSSSRAASAAQSDSAENELLSKRHRSFLGYNKAEDRKKVAESLNRVLADQYVLLTKTWNYHWYLSSLA
jgi:hypothetical protein